MFKKLFLVLALAATLVISGVAYSAQIGQECVIHPEAKIVVIGPNAELLPALMDRDANVTVVDEAPQQVIDFLNSKTRSMGMDWTGASIVLHMFNGQREMYLIVMPKDLDCN